MLRASPDCRLLTLPLPSCLVLRQLVAALYAVQSCLEPAAAQACSCSAHIYPPSYMSILVHRGDVADTRPGLE